ncbi:protein shifted-like [Scylla paramamosain]|uniref:protein shifted-like n=1 Tax=Scylla paramamosain TaxID=85552 RepID=UPI0030833C0F
MMLLTILLSTTLLHHTLSTTPSTTTTTHHPLTNQNVTQILTDTTPHHSHTPHTTTITTTSQKTHSKDSIRKRNIAQHEQNSTVEDGGGRGARRRRGRRRKGKEMRQRGRRRIKDLSLWLDQNQVKMFSGYLMEIFVIHNGRILPYILDPNFEKQLPVIPAQVENVNFTWCAGNKKYEYTFDQLQSQEEELLQVPTLSIAPHGTVPRKPRVFSVDMRCTGNISGIASFSIGLLIHTPKKELLSGMPLRLRLRKECRQQGPDPECDQKCQNGGVCDASQQCQCSEGYMGQYCDMALCYPQCLNGGSCTTPGRCSCPPGFQGRHCEGGICQIKCKNGGKCIQKDRCKCRRGFFGNWCQYSQCFVACINGGKCRGVNKCRCPVGYAGDHCEVVLPQGEAAALAPHRCRRRCRHGTCHGAECQCHQGYSGRWCRRRTGRGGGRQRVWVMEEWPGGGGGSLTQQRAALSVPTHPAAPSPANTWPTRPEGVQGSLNRGQWSLAYPGHWDWSNRRTVCGSVTR